MIRYINVADESAALLLILMPNCNKSKIAWHNWYNRNDAMLILYEMLHTCGIMHTQRGCKFENTKHRCLGMFLHKCDLHCSGRNWYWRGILWKAIIHSLSSTCFSFILFWIDELIHFYSIYMSSMNIEFHLWYENCRRYFQMYLQWKCLNFDYNFTEVCSQGSN